MLTLPRPVNWSNWVKTIVPPCGQFWIHFTINSHIQLKHSNFNMMCVEEIICYITNHTFKNQCLKYKKYLAVITHGLELLSTCMTLSRVTTPILHIKVCVQVLWSTAAFVKRIKPFVAPEGAACNHINCCCIVGNLGIKFWKQQRMHGKRWYCWFCFTSFDLFLNYP